MEALPPSMVNKAKLIDAVKAEAGHWRNLLPPEPGWELVQKKPGPFAGVTQARLLSGASNAPSVTVFARKAHQGVRPVPVVGMIERIALRALTDLALREIDPPARSIEDYRRYNLGPVLHGVDSKGPGVRLIDAKYDYVVQADVAAFYQYVDHSLLLNEMELRTELVAEPRQVVELLEEIQGERFGLPQLLDSSDRLSEIYIQAVERDLRRRGYHAWRYNDDFRVLANGYGQAQGALEQIARSAHRYGLVLNESKSSIVLFRNYYWRTLLQDPATGVETDEVDTSAISVWSADYPDLTADQLTGDVDAVLARLDLPPDPGSSVKPRSERPIDITAPTSEDMRDLRWAIGVAKAASYAIAATQIRRIVEYLPELTPRLCEYVLGVLGPSGNALQVWDELKSLTPVMNEWQRVWLVYLGRSLQLFSDPQALDWLRLQYEGAKQGLLHAEAALALAQTAAISFRELDNALRTQPAALAQWYVLGIKALPDVDQSLRDAVRDSDPLYRALMEVE